MLSFISIGVLYRFYGVLHELPGIATYSLTPACLDSLGMGSILALLTQSKPLEAWLTKYSSRIVLPIATVMTVFLYLTEVFKILNGLNLIFFDLFLAVVFACLVQTARRGFRGIGGRVLEWKPVTYVGKISYGVYVFHPFMPTLIAASLGALKIKSPIPEGWNFVLCTIATIGLATISWGYYELPLNNLKRFFSYGRGQKING